MGLSKIAALLSVPLLSAGFLTSVPASAETMKMMATLDSGQQVPPITEKAKGMAELSYDTESKKLNWTVTYSDLSGPAAAAHIHAPGGKGENAGVAIPFKDSLESPIVGSATLTEEQATELMGGKMYINIHTAAHKDGEIRGQIEKSAM